MYFRTYLLAMALLVVAWLPAPGSAAFWEKAVMPGELTQAHAEIEADCDSCHEKFRKKGQVRKCLACHEHADIARDIERKEGFHGRLGRLASDGCDTCHGEHLGRDADIVNLDRAAFDHSRTDFALKGGHVGLSCNACHEEGKKFRDAPGACIDCHKSDDAHAGKLGTQCADCHSESGWRKAEFDHDKTDFSLRGKHKQVACLRCHAGNHYKGVPKTCVACHRQNDVHNGDYGEQCQECHSSRKWDAIIFDHDKETDYPLRGAHRKAACDGCHQGNLKKNKPKKQCVACHRKDDWHKGRNGDKCESCHREDRWSNTQFDHSKTRFRLTGKHRDIECVACHKGNPRDERNRRACESCHLADDVHKGGAGPQCADCHSPQGWKQVRFDHQRDTGFALKGRHSKLECFACHRQAPKAAPLATSCYDCHREDDVHKGAQGRQCARCHNENDWAGQVRFDHDLSAFPLIGQHALASCEACHESSNFKDASTECVACHKEDDVHRQTLGRDCALCHNPNAWSAWLFDHDKQTRFRIEGAHRELVCADCHTRAVDEVVQSRQCVACHAQDDVHEGDFGRRCDRCHGQDTFRNPVFNHP